MHILIWMLSTSPKLHLWQNALNSLRFEPVLGPRRVPVTHPWLPRDLWQNNAGLVIQTPVQFWNTRGQHGKKIESGLASSSILYLGMLCVHLGIREFQENSLGIRQRLGVKGPGRAQQPTASPKALEKEFTKIMSFIDFLKCHLSYLLSVPSAYGSGEWAGIII